MTYRSVILPCHQGVPRLTSLQRAAVGRHLTCTCHLLRARVSTRDS